MTRWIIDRQVQTAHDALAWIERFCASYDLDALEHVKIGRGRSKRARGVYGKCEYPSEAHGRAKYRISCMLPGPWPCGITVRRKPLYVNEDGSVPPVPAGCRPGVRCIDRRTGRQWYRLIAYTHVDDLDEAVVWIFAHEAFHFLRRTRQVPGRNNEIEADAFADDCLMHFRQHRGKRDGRETRRNITQAKVVRKKPAAKKSLPARPRPQRPEAPAPSQGLMGWLLGGLWRQAPAGRDKAGR